MRITRTKYALSYIGTNFLGSLFIGAARPSVETQGSAMGILFILLILCGVQIYLAMGRLKDMNANPLWALATLIPLVSFILCFPKGTVGANQYGEDPRPAKAMPTSKIKSKE